MGAAAGRRTSRDWATYCLDRLSLVPSGLEERLSIDRFWWAMRTRAGGRWRLCRHFLGVYLRLLFVPNAHDYARFRFPRPLRFCYYLLKPVRIAMDYLGRPGSKRMVQAA